MMVPVANARGWRSSAPNFPDDICGSPDESEVDRVAIPTRFLYATPSGVHQLRDQRDPLLRLDVDLREEKVTTGWKGLRKVRR